MQPHQVPYDYFSMGVHCAQCSVHIMNPWFDMLNKKNESENRRIICRDDPNSSFMRLACCVQIRPELNEMICAAGENRNANGEWFGGDDTYAF